MCNSSDIIEIYIYVILSTLENLHLGIYNIFVYRFWTKNMPNLISAKIYDKYYFDNEIS